MEKITTWHCFDENKMKYVFNHIENGWQESNYPLPKNSDFVMQKRWEKSKWKKSFGGLKDGKVYANEFKIKLINIILFIQKLLTK